LRDCCGAAHAEGQIVDPDAEAISEAIQARKGILAGERTQPQPKGAVGLPKSFGLHPRREKMFGMGRPHALDRNAKVRIMHWARCLARRTEKGKAYGVITAKALAVLEALLWAFHNAKSGLCFPSYEKIAEAAHCARSTRGGGSQGTRGRRSPFMGPEDQAGAGELRRSARRQWIALAGAEDIERL
jgi:hypothetical protein